MRKGLFLVGALAMAATAFGRGSPAAEPEPARLSLKDAFARALQDNLALGRARAEVSAAEAQKRAALSLVLPRLALTGALTRNSDEVSFGSEEDRRTILPRNDWAFRLTLSQPVFAGLREKRAYDQAGLGIETAREGARASEDAVLLQVAADYLGVVQGDALVDAEQRTLELARKRKQQAEDLYEAGELTRVDVLKAETAIKAAERRLVAARQLRDQAAGRLRVDLVLDAGIDVEEPGVLVPPPPDEAALTARALEARPDIRQAQRALEIARLEVKKQQGAYLPVVTADAGYVRQKTTFPKDEYGFARLNVSIPIFQGGEIGARVAVARQRERQARLALDEARRRVVEEVRTALLDLQAAASSLALAQEQLATAQAEYEQVFDLYRSQEATAVDVESAETSLADARRAAATSRLDRKLAELKVWFAAGSLKAAVFEEVRP